MMMQKMNYYIVVEGVETEVQKQLLEKLGCDYLQGYYFAKPLPGKSFLEYVERFNLAQ